MDIMKELAQAGAVLQDRHFVYASGKHGSGYINMDPLFPNLKLIAELGAELVIPFRATWADSDRPAVQTIAAPATGGILLAYAAAYAWHRDLSDPLPAVWADKNNGDLIFERAGFSQHLQGKNVLVVEDLLTTGGSVEKVCRQAEAHGANIVGVSAIINRGGVTAADLGVSRLEFLAEVSFEAIDAIACPLCEQAKPIVIDVGHGAKFQDDNPDYAGGYVKLLG